MRMNGVGKRQSSKDSIQRVVTVNLYELKNSFSLEVINHNFNHKYT